jgi:hypothetical protein
VRLIAEETSLVPFNFEVVARRPDISFYLQGSTHGQSPKICERFRLEKFPDSVSGRTHLNYSQFEGFHASILVRSLITEQEYAGFLKLGALLS